MGSTELEGLKGVPNRRGRASDWITSRSRRFWLVVVASTVFVLTVSIILGIYLMVRLHRSSATRMMPRDARIIPREQTNFYRRDLIHSYLVDINTADNEATRAAVQYPNFASHSRIERLLLRI